MDPDRRPNLEAGLGEVRILRVEPDIRVERLVGLATGYEGDLLTGAANSHIATLVERQSRFVLLVRLLGKDTTSVVRALSRTVRALPEGLISSPTWDRGTELAAHKAFTVATDVRVYFCDPQSPWQRGSNENTNGLLRQYFPEGTDLSTYTYAGGPQRGGEAPQYTSAEDAELQHAG